MELEASSVLVKVFVENGQGWSLVTLGNHIQNITPKICRKGVSYSVVLLRHCNNTRKGKFEMRRLKDS